MVDESRELLQDARRAGRKELLHDLETWLETWRARKKTPPLRSIQSWISAQYAVLPEDNDD